MANIRDIRRRIKSVRNTGQITKAMKMVSAAKLRRAEEAMMRSRPYAGKLEDVVCALARRAADGTHPMLSEREEKRVRVIVVTADRGLCGAFNSNLLRASLAFIKDKADSGAEVTVDIVGRRGRDFFKRREFEIGKIWIGVSSKPEYEKAGEIADHASRLFLEGGYDAVYLVYNEFKTLITQKITVKRLVPFCREEVQTAFEEEFIFEPSEEEILRTLLPRQLSFSIFQALLESYASEQGARMAAMENATRSAKEMIDKLTLHANRVRQAAITKEIIEVVSGAEAQS
ncbi:MAG TPA: ATP synthase F1 subunit gamma [Acidobacteriota bacterium]|jgi:F-type H+-transporting ATPase subunit gamma|nr:ATP synthase F1 subunit gamma [Acidobacteriota bacterium]HNT17488.1 ATP synthase F1 subunit gamma [Acidobacteriota bacterium]HPA27770.1 ATP synthase F1 subunit gamma [Acidobacteriota bacterium]HQO20505.1 ATP synthase F1 subunit gamma [Acidobacteriota bacterium]HQQ46730.1 ATP synthase F1 subunit gamma [Acidobacteriota bacterium]